VDAIQARRLPAQAAQAPRKAAAGSARSPLAPRPVRTKRQ